MATDTKAVATTKIDTLRDLLEKAKSGIAAILPQHLTIERQLKIALMTTGKSKDLLECSAASILQCVVTASQLGLEPGGPLGHAYLVPYKGMATFIVGYRGLVELVRRSGTVTAFSAHIVYEKDEFLVELGTVGCIVHRPYLGAESPGLVVAAYAVARFTDGSMQFDVMTRAQVDGIRKRSRASANGPWVTDYEEMAKKTVARRLCKYLPMAVQVAEALDTDRPEETYPDFGAIIESEALREPKAKGLPAPDPTTTTTATTGAQPEIDPAASEQARHEIIAKIIAARDATDETALAAIGTSIVKSSSSFTSGDLKTLLDLHASSMENIEKAKGKK
jgi:recombination protein RecT